MTSGQTTHPDGTSRPESDRPESDLPDLVCVHGERRPLWQRVLMLAGALALLVGALIIWIVPVVGGSWFLYIPGFILLGTASRRCGRWVNRLERKLPLKARLMLRPKAVREAWMANRPAPH